jgi:hypothetical protein
MKGLRALGASGPFAEDRVKHWSYDCRVLGMQAYKEAMIVLGTPKHLATATVERLRDHGCQQMLWAFAYGGRGNRIQLIWDVRVARLQAPAAEAVPAVLSLGPIPLGASAVQQLEGQDAVLRAFSQPEEPSQGRRVWGIGPRTHLVCRGSAYAALAVGHVGATALLYAKDAGDAEAALVRLVGVILADLDRKGSTQLAVEG